MQVEKRMRKNPETITPEDYLASALVKMHKGGFRIAYTDDSFAEY